MEQSFWKKKPVFGCMYRAGFWILMAMMPVSLVLTGCGKQTMREDKEIKIAFLCSYREINDTVPELFWGMDMAVEDLNRKYRSQGYTVSTEFFDDGGEKGGAVKQAKQILEREDIDFIFVQSRDPELHKAVKKLGKEDRVTFWLDEIGQAARGKHGNYQYYNTFSLAGQATAMAKYLQAQEITRLAVLYLPDSSSETKYEGLVSAAKKCDIQIVGKLKLEKTPPDKAMKAIRYSSAQAVAVLAGDTSKNLDLIRAVRKMMPEVMILSDQTVDQASVLHTTAEPMEGVVIPCNVKTDWNPDELRSVIDRYENIYKDNTQAGRFSHGYFSVVAAADAVVACGTAEPKTLDQYFKSPSSARYKFDGNGNLIFEEVPVLRAEDGVFEIVSAEPVEE